MTASIEEVRAILSKWKTESISVFASLLGETFLLRLVCTIAEISPTGFMIAESPERVHPEEFVFRLDISFERAEGFDYSDLREAPQELQGEWEGMTVALLRFTIPRGTLALMELGPDVYHSRPTH